MDKTPKTAIQALRLDEIVLRGGTQSREQINDETVAEYAQAIQEGAELPPIIVYCDGVANWLADGFHRWHAHKLAGRQTIVAEARIGFLRDAILHSLSANVNHGLRRTNADKRKAVMTMLTNEVVDKDENRNPWSDAAISRQCVVGRTLVAQIRSSLARTTSEDLQNSHSQRPIEGEATAQPRTYTTKHGTTAVMNTANIGRKKKKRKSGGIAPDAFVPVLGHSNPAPKTALELPHDPVWAARGIYSALGAGFVRDLIPELTSLLEGDHE